MENILRTERKYLVSPDYMVKMQKDVDRHMRGIVVDWLVEVADEFKLSPQTLYLSINYIDRYLSSVPVGREKLQLIAVSSMLIASKYEEISAPPVEDFVRITDFTYSTEEVMLPSTLEFFQCFAAEIDSSLLQVLRMEAEILRTLSFKLTAVTPFVFLQKIRSLLKMDEDLSQLSLYLAEITIQDLSFTAYPPSHIAFSAVILALQTKSKSAVSETMRSVFLEWGICSDEVQACLLEMHRTHSRIHERSLRASYVKFSGPQYGAVSLLKAHPFPPYLTFG